VRGAPLAAYVEAVDGVIKGAFYSIGIDPWLIECSPPFFIPLGPSSSTLAVLTCTFVD